MRDLDIRIIPIRKADNQELQESIKPYIQLLPSRGDFMCYILNNTLINGLNSDDFKFKITSKKFKKMSTIKPGSIIVVREEPIVEKKDIIACLANYEELTNSRNLILLVTKKNHVSLLGEVEVSCINMVNGAEIIVNGEVNVEDVTDTSMLIIGETTNEF